MRKTSGGHHAGSAKKFLGTIERTRCISLKPKARSDPLEDEPPSVVTDAVEILLQKERREGKESPVPNQEEITMKDPNCEVYDTKQHEPGVG